MQFEIDILIDLINIGPIFSDIEICDFYPTLGLHGPRQKIKFNFGQENFKFNLEAHIQDERESILQAVQEQEIHHYDIHKLVQSYLYFNGYFETLDAFENASKMSRESTTLLMKENIQGVNPFQFSKVRKGMENQLIGGVINKDGEYSTSNKSNTNQIVYEKMMGDDDNSMSYNTVENNYSNSFQNSLINENSNSYQITNSNQQGFSFDNSITEKIKIEEEEDEESKKNVEQLNGTNDLQNGGKNNDEPNQQNKQNQQNKDMAKKMQINQHDDNHTNNIHQKCEKECSSQQNGSASLKNEQNNLTLTCNSNNSTNITNGNASNTNSFISNNSLKHNNQTTNGNNHQISIQNHASQSDTTLNKQTNNNNHIQIPNKLNQMQIEIDSPLFKKNITFEKLGEKISSKDGFLSNGLIEEQNIVSGEEIYHKQNITPELQLQAILEQHKDILEQFRSGKYQLKYLNQKESIIML